MTTLAELQHQFAELLRAGAPGGGSASLVRGSARLSADEQVEIYREQFWARHRDALREDFAAVAHALLEEGGAAAFDRLARAYFAECPSASYTLRDLGAALPAFVARRAPWSADPFLADLASLEWAFIEAFDAPDAPPLDRTTLPSLTEEEWPLVAITFDPSLQSLLFAYPVHAYRSALRSGQRPPPRRTALPTPQAPPHLSRRENINPVRPGAAVGDFAGAEAGAGPESARGYQVVVYRGPEGVESLALPDPGAAALLAELAAGTLLGDACIRAAAESGVPAAQFQAKLAGWFAEWTALGWIRAVTTYPRPSPPPRTSSGGS